MSEPRDKNLTPEAQPSKAANGYDRREGPGSVGVGLFHVKGYLRDLAMDDHLTTRERESLRAYYRQKEESLQFRTQSCCNKKAKGL
jgi:hypothetical protein